MSDIFDNSKFSSSITGNSDLYANIINSDQYLISMGDITGTIDVDIGQTLITLQDEIRAFQIQTASDPNSGYWASIWSTITQSNILTANVVNFNSYDPSCNGILLDTTGGFPYNKVKFLYTSVYKIQFSLNFKTTLSSGVVKVWLSVNNSTISDTTRVLNLNSSGDYEIASWDYILPFNANDTFQILWYSSNTNVVLSYSDSTTVSGKTIPSSPSAMVTIEQISNTKIGHGVIFDVSYNNLVSGSVGYVTDTVTDYSDYSNHSLMFGIVQGIQGIQGDQGIQGIQGDQGIQGFEGPSGAQGIQGIQGMQGMQGDQGIQGPTGLDGPQGIQGIQGDQGIQGIQGDKGNKGDNGNKGDKGDTGDAGANGSNGSNGSDGDSSVATAASIAAAASAAAAVTASAAAVAAVAINASAISTMQGEIGIIQTEVSTLQGQVSVLEQKTTPISYNALSLNTILKSGLSVQSSLGVENCFISNDIAIASYIKSDLQIDKQLTVNQVISANNGLTSQGDINTIGKNIIKPTASGTNKKITVQNTVSGCSIDFMASTAGIQTRDAGFDIVPPLIDGTNDTGSLSINADTIQCNGKLNSTGNSSIGSGGTTTIIGNALNPLSSVIINGIVSFPLGVTIGASSYFNQW